MNLGSLPAPQRSVGGKLLQVVYAPFQNLATGTTQIPQDDTIPQVTEGNQFMTATIKPLRADSILQVEALAQLSSNFAGNSSLITAIFRDGAADAIGVGVALCDTTNGYHAVSAVARVVAGNTNSTVFTVRCGFNAAGTITFNGTTGSRFFGGVMTSAITIYELEP